MQLAPGALDDAEPGDLQTGIDTEYAQRFFPLGQPITAVV
jgi:hypothetical protein